MVEIDHLKPDLHLPGVINLLKEYISDLKNYILPEDLPKITAIREKELIKFPEKYLPPYGCFLVATYHKEIAGCVAVCKLDEQICEMRRLYVHNKFRNFGIGHMLVKAIIEESVKIGYKTMRLDSTVTMKAAVKLYHSFGFREIAPYRKVPVKNPVFLELSLNKNIRLNDF